MGSWFPSWTLLLVEDGKITDTVAQADGSETKSEVLETANPLFDRYALGLAVAAMEELEEWQGLWLKGVYPGTKQTTDYPILIGAKMEFADTSGKGHEVYPMMMPISGMTLGYYYVSNEAPYFFGFEAKDMQTQEVSMRVVLKQFQLLN